MLNNSFITRYKSIPIAGYHFSTEGLKCAAMMPPLENHREFEIILIKKGHALITAEGKTFTASDDSLLFFSPYMLHSMEVPAHEAFEYICLCFDLSLISNESLASQLEENKFIVSPHIASTHSKILQQYVIAVDEAVSSSTPYWEMTVKGNLPLLFAHIMAAGLTETPSPLSKETGFCLRVLDYIKEHYRENLSSSSTAADLFYEKSYFCRLFKRNFGISFSRYLLAYRINKSKELLADKEKSIARIALDTGFSGSSYFVKAFRNLNGITPKKFRDTYFK